MVWWRKKTMLNCTRCGEFERNVHVWTWQNPETVQLQTQEEEDRLQVWMIVQDKDVQILDLLCSSLLKWQAGLVPYTCNIQVGNDQERLGWGLFIEGCLSMTWRTTQHLHSQGQQ
jgi:hypothetical protein